MVPAVALIFAGLTTGRHVTAAQSGSETSVDFLVLTNDGKPVPDLKAEEVTLRLGGRPRPIKALRLVKIEGGAGGGSALPAPFATNADAGGAARTVQIVVEDESLRPGAEREVRAAITTFLDLLSPGDRVAFSTAPRDVARVGFGAGSAKVREALNQLTGRQPANMSSADRTCRTRDTLLALRGLVAGLAGSETPTTVILFSSQMSTPATGGLAASGACDLTTEHYQGMGPAVAAARANLYVIQQDPTITQRDEGLENLAGVTGAGRVLHIATAAPLARIASETSAYYVASFAPDNNDRPGQPARMEIKVAREGVTTRARNEAVLSRAPAGGKPGAVQPRDMMRETRAFRDLPIRAVAYASRAGADKMGVLVMGEPADPSVKLTAATAAIIDPASGKILAQQSADEKQLAISPVVLSMPAAPGSYRVRFGAMDASGKGGAVDVDLTAELTPAGPLKLGSLVLTAFRNNSAVPAIQFGSDEKIVGILEMYGQITGQVSARMEVASTLDGPAISTVQPGGRQTSEPDKFILTGEIPIGTLAPGDYVVRAFVGIQGQPEGKVIKTFRKTK